MITFMPARHAWLWLLALWLAASCATAEVAVPPLRAHVTDLADTLDAGQRATLEGTLANFETERGAQIAVLIVPTTAPEAIEQYAIRVAEQWKLGRKGVDDGVLLLVAKQDRALRIEVGYGLEGVIPDAIANRIVEDVIVPYFKRGDYAGGIQAGVQQLMRLIEGEALPLPTQRGPPAGGAEANLPLLIMGALAVGLLLRAIFGRLLGAGLTGIGAGVLASWMFGSLFFGLLLGVFAFFFLLGGGGGFFPGAGGWGSSPRGGGGFGGGMSGGGGGFGGGGASGRW